MSQLRGWRRAVGLGNSPFCHYRGKSGLRALCFSSENDHETLPLFTGTLGNTCFVHKNVCLLVVKKSLCPISLLPFTPDKKTSWSVWPKPLSKQRFRLNMYYFLRLTAFCMPTYILHSVLIIQVVTSSIYRRGSWSGKHFFFFFPFWLQEPFWHKYAKSFYISWFMLKAHL